MADPYILGASSGASAAVGLAFVIGGSFSTSTTAISAFAFGGSMLSLLLVYSVGMIGNTGSGNRLVLAGMAVSVILTAATQFFISIAPDTYTVRNITSWTMGSLTSARWNNIAIPFIGSVVGSCFFMFMSRAYNETRALDARKASCAAPISMGRGEIPVELCQQPSVFCLFRIDLSCERGSFYARKNCCRQDRHIQ